MFDDYEDYRLSHSDDEDSGGYSGDGCLSVVLIGIAVIVILSLF